MSILYCVILHCIVFYCLIQYYIIVSNNAELWVMSESAVQIHVLGIKTFSRRMFMTKDDASFFRCYDMSCTLSSWHNLDMQQMRVISRL